MIGLSEGKHKAKSRKMDENGKRTILVVASILLAREYAQPQGKPPPALESAVSHAASLVERIVQKIDSKSVKPVLGTHDPGKSRS